MIVVSFLRVLFIFVNYDSFRIIVNHRLFACHTMSREKAATKIMAAQSPVVIIPVSFAGDQSRQLSMLPHEQYPA